MGRGTEQSRRERRKVKQTERQERSRQAIIQAAIDEFGSSDFEAVTMDRICASHGISKGMMYHYFSNKDELFLCCVSGIFQDLWNYLSENMSIPADEPIFESIKHFFGLRESFFQTRDREKHIFENAVFYPPKHLAAKIQKYREPIHEQNDHFLRQIVSKVKLRENLDQGKAIRYLNSIYQLFWNALHQYCLTEEYHGFHSTLNDAEELLEMFLFGVIDREQTEKQPLPQTE